MIPGLRMLSLRCEKDSVTQLSQLNFLISSGRGLGYMYVGLGRKEQRTEDGFLEFGEEKIKVFIMRTFSH